MLYAIPCMVFGCGEVPKPGEGKAIQYPLSIEGLRARTYHATIVFEKELRGGDVYDSKLVSYYSDGLKVYALVQEPKRPPPEQGYPVIIFAHGFHPDPKNYGVDGKTGISRRPGEYYRGMPEAYAREGFLTITPDYRGHNASQGYGFTQTGYLASAYYAIDVLHLISGLHQFERVDLDNVFLVGHSMGGEVALKTVLATPSVKAASLWAPVSAGVYEQAIYYGHRADQAKESGSEGMDARSIKKNLAKTDAAMATLDHPHLLALGDPINYVQDMAIPLVIHHAVEERAVPYRWSEGLAAKLYAASRRFTLYPYQGNDHLLQGDARKKAIERDVIFFNKQKKQ